LKNMQLLYHIHQYNVPFACSGRYLHGSAPINWHEYYEFACCIKGNAEILCNSTRYAVTRGDIIAINPYIFHDTSSSDGVFMYYLVITQDFFSQNGFGNFAPIFPEEIHDPKLFELFLAIIKSQDPATSFRDAHYKNAVLTFILYLCENYSTDAQTTATIAPDFVKNTLDYINQNYSQPISLDEISAYVGVSKYHMCREFKKYTSYSPLEYRNLVRCQSAKQLIDSGSNVSSAAHSCGFTSLSHFSEVYKQYMGKLPSEK